MRRKLHTFRRQLAAAGALLRLVWRAAPGFSLLCFGLALLLGLLPMATIVLTSALLQTLVDATRAGPTALFPRAFLALLALLAGAHLLTQVGQQLNTAVHDLYRTRVTNYIQLLISAKAASIDLAHFEDPAFHNQLQTAANEASFRVPMFVDRLLIGGSTAATFVSLTTLLLLWQPWIVPVLLGSALGTIWLATHFSAIRVRTITERAEAERKKYYLQGLLTSEQAAKELRLFGLGPWLLDGLRAALERIYAQDRRLALRELRATSAAGLLLAAVQPALIAFCAWQVVQGLLSIGQFSLYSQAIIQLQAGWTQLMFIQSGLHENSLFAEQLFQFLALQPQIEAPREAKPSRAPGAPLRIEFRRVCFAYPGSQQRVLDDVSFVIEPGETIALVGANGAGKTTLVKLLTGLYEPSDGAILLDGVDLRTLDRAAVRAYLSVIFQDYTIYHLSTRDNIGIGWTPAIDQFERIQAAARRSGLEQLIARLPHGYETVLGRFWEHGHELSGGQRQLVALARALMRDAPILILDEPSAALDIYAEQRFFGQLLSEQTDRAERTVIFISHRFTTVRRAQRILVLEHGRITEQGSHAELMAQGGRYAEMFAMQAAPYSQPLPDATAAAEADAPTTM